MTLLLRVYERKERKEELIATGYYEEVTISTIDGTRTKVLLRKSFDKTECGAKCRDGHPCRRQKLPGKKRCKLHGGASTGPKTAEGRKRIGDAQRRRAEDRRAKGRAASLYQRVSEALDELVRSTSH
jgi:hypothetical protein